MLAKTKFVKTVTVIDPDTNGEVEVSIFKDENSGGMFGIDTSYLLQNWDEDEEIQVLSPFQTGNEYLVLENF